MNSRFRRQSVMRIIMIFIIIFLSASGLMATTYYVDATNGNDSHSGTSPANAWQTITKVNNSTFQPGDSILFKRGSVWNATLSPRNNGTKSNPIVYAAYGTGVKPTFDGNGTIDGVIEAKYSHLEFENLRAVNSNGWAIRVEPASGRNTQYIYDIRFDSLEESDNAGSGGMVVRNVDTLYVTNSVFRRYKNNGIAIMGTASFPTQHTWLLNNYFNSENNGNGGITLHESPTGDLPGNGHIIKNNEFYNHNEEALDLQGGDILVENNLCVNGGYHGIVVSRSSGNIKILRNKINKGGINTGNGIEVRQSDVTIAYNLIYGDSYRGISIMDPGSPNNIKVFNNTIYQPVVDAIQINCTGLNNLMIENNIIYNTQTTRQILNTSDSNFDNPGWKIDHNLYYVSNNSKLFYEGNTGNWYSLSQFQSVYGQGLNSEEADPLFVDASNDNFRLNDNSPAIGAGDNNVWSGIADVYDNAGTQITNSVGTLLSSIIGNVDIGAFEYISNTTPNHEFGDVDFNGSVQSFDAAATLQYSVGMDPFPTVDPAPWSSERATVADVDGNSIVQAYDAALIQQYVVGILDNFPAAVSPKQQISETSNDTLNLAYTQVGNKLVVSVPNATSLYASNIEIQYSTQDLQFSPAVTTDFSQNYTLLENDHNGTLNVGMMNAQPPSGEGDLIRIPLQILSDSTTIQVNEVVNSEDPIQRVITLYRSVTETKQETPGIPLTNNLFPNFPNPFNPSTKIKYNVKHPDRVTLSVYDLKGREIKSLVNKAQSAGSYIVTWDGTDFNNIPVASGLYLYRLRIGQQFAKTEQMSLLR